MPLVARLGLLLLAVVTIGVRPANGHEGDGCARCDPGQLLAAVEATLDRVSLWQLEAVDPGNPPPQPALLSAFEAAHAGHGKAALRLARQAAARCFLRGDVYCGEGLPLLAERMVAAHPEDADVRQEALAVLSLVPWDALSSDACEDAMILRYRLAELGGPRRAKAQWADACGAVGRSGELGYRAAKAAILHGQLGDAEARLQRVRNASRTHVVRAAYLQAVVRVAEGRLADAEDAFRGLLALAPEPQRTQEEDDARILAALQLARLARERHAPEEALDLYRAVPAGGVGRDEALLEGAVVAAHVGDLGAARLYLDSLPVPGAQEGRQLDVHRLRASLVFLDGDDDAARATFRELTAIGRDVRARFLSPGGGALDRMRADPSLGGLVDPSETRRLLALEDSLVVMADQIAAGRAEIAAVRSQLAAGKIGGTLDDALLQLEEADALLRRVEALGSADGPPASPAIAGPVEAALLVTGEVSAVRRRLGQLFQEVRSARDRRRRLVELRLTEVDGELDDAAMRLDVMAAAAREDLRLLRGVILTRGSVVADALEMSEDVGELEIRFRKKQMATLQVERAVREYNEEKRSLKRDFAEE